MTFLKTKFFLNRYSFLDFIFWIVEFSRNWLSFLEAVRGNMLGHRFGGTWNEYYIILQIWKQLKGVIAYLIERRAVHNANCIAYLPRLADDWLPVVLSYHYHNFCIYLRISVQGKNVSPVQYKSTQSCFHNNLGGEVCSNLMWRGAACYTIIPPLSTLKNLARKSCLQWLSQLARVEPTFRLHEYLFQLIFILPKTFSSMYDFLL